MEPFDASERPRQAQPGRELTSLLLMLAPLATVLVFLLVSPGVWTSSLAVTFSAENKPAGNAPGWILATLALAAAALCAWIGVLGRRADWQVNRRWQRGVLGSLAATLGAVLLSASSMTHAIAEGRPPAVGLAVVLTICAIFYGVVCAVVSPPDRVDTWYPNDAEDS